MSESINIEPNWNGLRAWVLNVAKTHPETARKIAAEMGSEAPQFTCQECKRTIEIDNLNGKGADARGFCVGFDTCLQRTR